MEGKRAACASENAPVPSIIGCQESLGKAGDCQRAADRVIGFIPRYGFMPKNRHAGEPLSPLRRQGI
jgi:hypothetical protein